jgi:RNA polymerase sigma-70 factor (ECF subfamily)
MDDDALARHLAADLDRAFEALVLAHQDRLYTIALRLLGDTGDAEEVAQDAFVRAYRAMTAWPPERIATLRLRPWLASITVNLSRNRRRRLADRRPALRLAGAMAAGVEPATGPGASPDAAGLRREAAEEWSARLLRCPAALRVPVVLRHVDGLSYGAIAEILDRPVGTVKAQVHRGVAWLRSDLERGGETQHEELTA